MMYPLHALNLSILKVLGRSDLFLKLEIIKQVLAVPVIVIGVLFGIKAMIIGMIVNSLIAYYMNTDLCTTQPRKQPIITKMKLLS
jgi:teichuronic acid exporter